MLQTSWEEKVAAKRASCLEALPNDWRLTKEFLETINANIDSSSNLIQNNVIQRCGILSAEELKITELYTASELVKEIGERRLSAEKVTIAFSKRAAVAGQLTACITEAFYDTALQRARFLDEYMTKEGKPFGPLHGLPISLKDCFCVEGVDSTIGYVSFLDHGPSSKNSSLVEVLLSLGAVLYCKTNLPQTIMTPETDNNIFGRTLNPHNTSLTAGGSSGGEGALIALRGSLLGVGTDIGGSIRIPSICCGTYGFKPSVARIPYGGITEPALIGMPGILPCAGPLASSMEDLELFMKTVLNAKPWQFDSSVLPIPWTPRPSESAEELGSRALNIGVLPEQPGVALHPPVVRALENALAALSTAGQKIIRLPFKSDTAVLTAWEPTFDMYMLDPLDTAKSHIFKSGEPPVPAVLRVSLPEELKHIYSIDELAALNVKREKYAAAWHQVWLEHDLDILICPGLSTTAVAHNTSAMPIYTTMWNYLDYPACSIPFQTASKFLDPDPVEIQDSLLTPSYNPEEVHGAPCSIQLVAPRFQDEKCMEVAKIIDKILRDAT